LVAALDATVARARGSALYRERLARVRIRSLADLRALPLTTRAELQAAGTHGTRALPLAEVCHYGESSGTSGASNSTWLTAEDFRRDADAIRAAHPEVFAPGRVILNRFPFMAAPAHLVQLIAQRGGGVAIPAGNINWDVPFPRALELARQTGAQVLAALPLEPVVLGELARAQGIDPARVGLDTLFLGGAPVAVEIAGRRLYPYDLIDAGAAAADALDSSVFFVVILADRVLVRIEARTDGPGDPTAALSVRLPGVPVEVEPVEPGMLLDVEMLSRSPHVYKPVVLSDWRRPGRRILSVGEGMIEWPRPTWAEGRRWLRRTLG